MIPSFLVVACIMGTVYQRGLVIDSQHQDADAEEYVSISKGIGD